MDSTLEVNFFPCQQILFVQLGFNFSNGVTDTLESSSMLIYLIQVKGICTQKVLLIKTRK